MKKFISLVMSLILIVMVIPILNIEVNASTSGDCGENVIDAMVHVDPYDSQKT